MMAHPDSAAPAREARVADGMAVEQHQERAFVMRHGHLSLRRNLLTKSSTKKRFDSGEWAMERAGLSCTETVPADVPVEQLSPKLGPEGGPLERRPSRLEYMIPEMESPRVGDADKESGDSAEH
ncbi:unnamed protein product [Ostreobium quekettii]|uniref:Uncharacterized protein n=1 Tax=Ostreobium quekettii TaxID=121088 RepID=A0A8S1ILG0_9CHLO|nr:unnamed protein product [Ostreobium quekettii]|eukprot:evm.model.scf_7.13 EVM.evm.TU.scf_7.13   scf_7:114719-115967(+)